MPMRPPVHRNRSPDKASEHRAHNAPRAFYHSGWWRALSDAVLERDGHRCQLRLLGCVGVATIADHVQPRPRGEASITSADCAENLRAVCRQCHNRILHR